MTREDVGNVWESEVARMVIQPLNGQPSGMPYGNSYQPQQAGQEKSMMPQARANSGEVPIGAANNKQQESALKGATDTAKKAECQTCKNRKYQDGSDDPGVSFKTPTAVDPKAAGSAVRAHENEHVVREQAKAQREDRRVVSQSVMLHTAICPECGKAYVSGGTTRTVTKADPEQPEDKRFAAGLQNDVPPLFLNQDA